MSMKATPWSAPEVALIVRLVAEGAHSSECAHLFPDRSSRAVNSRLWFERKQRGIPNPPRRAGFRRKVAGEPVGDAKRPSRIYVRRLRREPDQHYACRAMLARMLETGAHWLPNRPTLEHAWAVALGQEVVL